MTTLKVSLFRALRVADLIAVDGYDAEYSNYPDRSHHTLELANEEELAIDDQTIELGNGDAIFKDVTGEEHSLNLSVIHALKESDLGEET